MCRLIRVLLVSVPLLFVFLVAPSAFAQSWISAVTATKTTTTATITWTTAVPANSQVTYGTTTSYGSSSALNSSLVTTHSVALTSLTAGTTYHYRVLSADSTGALVTGLDNVFTTTQATIPGLVAAYSFNEGTGTTVGDSSGSGNMGTVANTTWTTSAKFGNALVFNGSSSFVTINDSGSLHLTTGMTLEAWVNPSTVSSAWRDVIYKGNDIYYLEGTSDNSSRPAGGGTWGSLPVYGAAALTTNTWAYLALTYDGANLRLYVNGTQVATQARTGNIASSTNPLQIGGDSIYGQYFQGTIDEVRVYNAALTATQIQSDMVTPIGTGGGDTQPPTAPSNVTATATSGSQINLSWTASTDNVGVTQYLVERCQGTGCTVFVQVGTSTGTTFNNTGLTSATSYSYRVRATDAAGNLSGYSNVASATPAAAISVSISPTTATVVSGGTQQFSAQVTNTSNTAVTWSATSGTVSTTGLFTAPTVTATKTVTVTATSVADNTKSASATVTVNAPATGKLSASPTSISFGSVAVGRRAPY